MCVRRASWRPDEGMGPGSIEGLESLAGGFPKRSGRLVRPRARHWKCRRRATASRVQIPPAPPVLHTGGAWWVASKSSATSSASASTRCWAGTPSTPVRRFDLQAASLAAHLSKCRRRGGEPSPDHLARRLREVLRGVAGLAAEGRHGRRAWSLSGLAAASTRTGFRCRASVGARPSLRLTAARAGFGSGSTVS